MPDDVPITKCVCCADGRSFTDQPADYAKNRWPGAEGGQHDLLFTRCDTCGASYPVESVDASVRKEVSE